MPKNKKAASRPEVTSPVAPIPMLKSSTEDPVTAPPTVPKDLHDLLDHLDGYTDDDEGRFDATYLWPWRNLTSKRRNLNERILRIVLKRLLAPKASLEQHWRRLHADVSEHRRRQRTNGKLSRANAAEMVLNAVVDALLPAREASAKEMASIMRGTCHAAAQLIAYLTLLRSAGMTVEELLPTEETIHCDDEKSGGREYGGAYADARFFIQMKLPRSLTQEQRGDVTEYVLRIVMGDPLVAIGILGRIAQATRAFKARRHNLSGRQRFAYLMARHMVRDSIRFFGAPRYERAEAFTKVACGIQVKGLRQMMERERNTPATERGKTRRTPLRGN